MPERKGIAGDALVVPIATAIMNPDEAIRRTCEQRGQPRHAALAGQ